jgi:hypothetical protein
VHTTKDVDDVSWWQSPDALWIDLLDLAGEPTTVTVADVGSGASVLVDALVDRGHPVVAVDVAPAALARVRDRLGSRADAVRFVAADVRALRLDPPVQCWHDRAVFHFLVDEADRAAYREALQAGLAPGGLAVVATFAQDGPEQCSGLPVQRYDAAGLVAALGFTPDDVVRTERRVHRTWGGEQPFTVVAVRRPRETGERFRAAVEARDLDAMAAVLAPDVRLFSPVAFRPFAGREAVRELFGHLLEVLEDFHYVDELVGEGTHALVFRAHIGEAEVEGLDHLRLGPDGLVTVFTVMVRPLSAAVALAQAMAPRVGHLPKG